jgi:hypothetical protein
MSDSRQWVYEADPERLAELFARDPSRTAVWRPEELGAVLRHQMASAIQVDLVSLTDVQAQRVRLLADAEGLLLKSYSDLLRHPVPPLDLLEIIKDYAKVASATPNGALPPAVARVLYFACIAAALVRRGTRLSSLAPADLREGFAWVLEQDWVDPFLKELCGQALAAEMPGSATPSPPP